MPSAPPFPPEVYFATDSMIFPKCEKCGINNLDDSHLTGLILIGGKREGDDLLKVFRYKDTNTDANTDTNIDTNTNTAHLTVLIFVRDNLTQSNTVADTAEPALDRTRTDKTWSLKLYILIRSGLC